MSALILAVVVVPLAGWMAGRELRLKGKAPPSLPVAALTGFVAAPAVTAWFGRPLPEVLASVVVSAVSVAGLVVANDPPVMVAFGLLGACWGLYLAFFASATPGSVTQARAAPVPGAAAAPPTSNRSARRAPANTDEALGFAIELRCPGCGAELAVPVYHRMVRCEYCASEHVVTTPPAPVVAMIPDRITTRAQLQEAVLEHYRYQRYVTLYQQRVAPLLQQQRAAEAQRPEQLLLSGGRPNPLVELAEAQVRHAADRFAQRLRKGLRLQQWRRLASPYWHRFGTLYQTAFGRDQSGEKRVELAVRTFEASLAATNVPLPDMGKLSYLKALTPLTEESAATLPVLSLDRPLEALDERVEQLSQRNIDLPLRIIGRRSVFVPEVTARIYRPWHLVTGEAEGEAFTLLVDGGTGRVAGPPPAELPATESALALETPPPRLTPNRCPECGGTLVFSTEAVADLCGTCFRLLEMSGGRWRMRPYLWEEPRQGQVLVPFWRFPFRLRTATGEVIRTVAHFTDGIDGTLDQIGAVPEGEDVFFVPAFRTRVGPNGVRFYRRLWPLVQGYTHHLHAERFSPAQPPGDAVDVTLPEAEARVFATVYLALAFTPRDLARAEIRRMREQFLESEMTAGADLAYLAIPGTVVEPFRALLGRVRPGALTALEGQS